MHAELIAEMIRSLREPAEDIVSTLVLTSFRAQVVALNHSLRRAGLPATATTIHRAQGAEADVVVVDLVETDPRSISDFLRAQGPGDLGAQLLNVAVSRAKRAVVVVAAVDPLLRSPATGRFVKAFLTRLQEEAVALDPLAYRRPGHPRAAGSSGIPRRATELSPSSHSLRRRGWS
jgi:superfamily I DNA and/or RNA helicase